MKDSVSIKICKYCKQQVVDISQKNNKTQKSVLEMSVASYYMEERLKNENIETKHLEDLDFEFNPQIGMVKILKNYSICYDKDKSVSIFNEKSTFSLVIDKVYTLGKLFDILKIFDDDLSEEKKNIKINNIEIN
jgi:hypothetical protein